MQGTFNLPSRPSLNSTIKKFTGSDLDTILSSHRISKHSAVEDRNRALNAIIEHYQAKPGKFAPKKVEKAFEKLSEGLNYGLQEFKEHFTTQMSIAIRDNKFSLQPVENRKIEKYLTVLYRHECLGESRTSSTKRPSFVESLIEGPTDDGLDLGAIRLALSGVFSEIKSLPRRDNENSLKTFVSAMKTEASGESKAGLKVDPDDYEDWGSKIVVSPALKRGSQDGAMTARKSDTGRLSFLSDRISILSKSESKEVESENRSISQIADERFSPELMKLMGHVISGVVVNSFVDVVVKGALNAHNQITGGKGADEFSAYIDTVRAQMGLTTESTPEPHPKFVPGTSDYNPGVVKEFIQKIQAELLILYKAKYPLSDDPKDAVKGIFKNCMASILNYRDSFGFQEKIIDTEVLPGTIMHNTVVPIRQECDKKGLGLYSADDVKGVCPATKDGRALKHPMNAWVHTFDIADDNPVSFTRHGAIRNIESANELLVSMLPTDVISAAKQGAVTTLYEMQVSSVSLLNTLRTTKERDLFDTQSANFKALAERGYLECKGEDGETVRIPVRLNISLCNFGTNAGSVNEHGGLGWDSTIDDVNRQYMEQLNARFEAFDKAPKGDGTLIKALKDQIDQIWRDQTYKNPDCDPYKMVSRLLLLEELLGGKSLVNCKSGKDRTSFAIAEAEFLKATWALTRELPEPGERLDQLQFRMFIRILASCGGFEVQMADTGGPGYKVYKAADKNGLLLRLSGDGSTGHEGAELALLAGLSSNVSS